MRCLFTTYMSLANTTCNIAIAALGSILLGSFIDFHRVFPLNYDLQMLCILLCLRDGGQTLCSTIETFDIRCIFCSTLDMLCGFAIALANTRCAISFAVLGGLLLRSFSDVLLSLYAHIVTLKWYNIQTVCAMMDKTYVSPVKKTAHDRPHCCCSRYGII